MLLYFMVEMHVVEFTCHSGLGSPCTKQVQHFPILPQTPEVLVSLTSDNNSYLNLSLTQVSLSLRTSFVIYKLASLMLQTGKVRFREMKPFALEEAEL